MIYFKNKWPFCGIIWNMAHIIIDLRRTIHIYKECIPKGSAMTKTIILTGGGSAGHVTPNLALAPRLVAEGYTVHYIGTADGIERNLVEGREDITYHAISAGKLRRYFSLKNFTDPFRVVKGMFQARRIIRAGLPSLPTKATTAPALQTG